MLNRRQTLTNILQMKDGEDIRKIWNHFCYDNNRQEIIYDNNEYELSQIFSGSYRITDALRAACCGNYRFTDAFFIYDVDGKLESFDRYETHRYVDYDFLADYLMDFGNEEYFECFDTIDLEELKDAFIDYYEEKTGKMFVEDENFDCIGYDFITHDWDEIIENLIEQEK